MVSVQMKKTFADDTSVFSVVKNAETSHRDLSSDLELVNSWAYQWKMCFNPEPSKQAVKVIFSRQRESITHQIIKFNNLPVAMAPVQKYLGMFLDSKLSFQHHLKEKNLKSK